MARRNEGSEDSRNTERLRSLKKRYLRVCRENARLRKLLAQHEIKDTEESELESLQLVEEVEVSKCQKCKQGEYTELSLNHVKLQICNSCGHRIKEKVS